MELFNVKQQLGRGTFGTIHLVEKLHNKEKLVIKQIAIDLISDFFKTAQNEVNILRSLDHPNIIQYFDNYVKNRTFYIVMEYASHGNLQEYIAKRRPNNYLHPQTVMDFFCQILLGLDHIHEKRIIHRDLKCENIFVTGQNADIMKIGDFGISKLNSSNMAKTLIGTCNYVAPEVCDGKPYDNKTDIWALGCVLYELCQLEKMFDGTISNVVLSIAQGKVKPINIKRYGKQMQELLNLLLQVDPKLRPGTKMLMTLADVFPTLHSLTVNLGCIM